MPRITAVYLLSNRYNTVIYTGVTSHLEQRIFQHKNKVFPGSFSARYEVHKLVYFETFDSIRDAITREKQIKAGSRARKVSLIESVNPDWQDLSECL